MIKTEIEWFTPEERMPAEGTEEVLAVEENGGISRLSYSDKNKLFNSDNDDAGQYSFPVKYWAYIPPEFNRS